MGDFFLRENKSGKAKDSKKSVNTFVSNKGSQLGNKGSASVVSISLGKKDHITVNVKKKK